MLSTVSQLTFAAEFLGMLVAASALVLLALRPELVRGAGRASLAIGFLVVGAVAFARGSLLVEGRPVLLGAVRLAGVVLLAAGLPRWRPVRTRLALAAGAAAVAAAAALQIAGGAGTAVDSVLLAANVVLAAALLAAARGSIAARVATNAAATLLLVVLVLSLALSAVIADAVQHDQLVALGSLSQVDARQVDGRADVALGSATSLTSALGVGFPGTGAAAEHQLRAELGHLSAGYAGQTVGYQPAGAAAFGFGPDPALLPAASALGAVRTVTCRHATALVTVLGGRLESVAASAVCATGATTRYGTALVVAPIGPAFVSTLLPASRSATVSLAGASSALSPAGHAPPRSILLAARAGARPRVQDGRLVAVSSLTGTHVLVVVTAPVSTLVSTRQSLFRTLFLIALGGTMLALGLAVFTGDRITAGVRRLTEVAQRIQLGRSSERAGVVSDDEVGVLAGAFDAMVSSIEEQSAALRDAADAETRLRNRLEAIVAGMGDALVAVDAAGRVTDFNRAAEQLTGTAAAAVVGRPVTEVLALAGDGPDDLPARLGAPAADAPWGGLGDLRRADGLTVPVALSAGAVEGPPGEAGGSVLVLRDLRREREVEQMKTEFLSRVGHELRTPLTGILGYADILRRRDVPAAQARRWHGEIVDAGKRQLRIIRLLEFFASSGGGQLSIRRETLDLRRLVHGVVGPWAERLGPSHPVDVRVARSLPPVTGDGHWLGLALDELIDNAVKFSPDGGTITVRALVREAGPASGRSCVEISVRDHGRGMGAEERRRAFSAFVQGDTSDTREFGGLGLGLAFVQRVVEAHGGGVGFHTAPGRGAVFAIRVPLAPPGSSPRRAARVGAARGL